MVGYTSGEDLVIDVLHRGDELTDGSSSYDTDGSVLRWINRRYAQICDGGQSIHPEVNHDWPWMYSETPGSLLLEPKEDLTGAVTNNSTAITLSASHTASLAGWHLRVEGNNDLFRVASHTAATDAITLDLAYTGTTAAAATVKVFKLEYNLASDFQTFTGPGRVYKDNKHRVNIMDPAAMDEMFPMSDLLGGVPEGMALIGEQKVRFSHYGRSNAGEYIRFDYDYKKRITALTKSSGSIPLVPIEYRHIIADAALYDLLMSKDDNRANAALAEARSGIEGMKRRFTRKEASSGKPGHLYVRPTKRFSKGPLRTESGLIIG